MMIYSFRLPLQVWWLSHGSRSRSIVPEKRTFVSLGWCDEDEKLAVSLVYNYVYYVYYDDVYYDDDDDEEPRDGIG